MSPRSGGAPTMNRRSSSSCRFESWSAVPGWTTSTLPLASSCCSGSSPLAHVDRQRPVHDDEHLFLNRVDVAPADGAGRVAEEVRARVRHRVGELCRQAGITGPSRPPLELVCVEDRVAHAVILTQTPVQDVSQGQTLGHVRSGRERGRRGDGEALGARHTGSGGRGAGGGVGGASVVAFVHGPTLAHRSALDDSARWCPQVRSTALRRRRATIATCQRSSAESASVRRCGRSSTGGRRRFHAAARGRGRSGQDDDLADWRRAGRVERVRRSHLEAGRARGEARQHRPWATCCRADSIRSESCRHRRHTRCGPISGSGRTTRARARSAARGGSGSPTASARGSRPGSAPSRRPSPAAAAS